jgi:hypothetical protein
MPSLWHDSGIDLIRDDPDIVIRLLRRAGEDLPADARLSLAPANENDRMLSKDLDPDIVLVEGSVDRPARVVIVELQRARNAGKLRQWPRYAASKWLRYECPVDLLVICPDETTADWYARPIPTALRGYTHWPIIIRSAQVPAMANAEQATADPVMAVMSVVYHGVNWTVLNAFAAGILALRPDEAKKYYEYALAMSPEVVRDALEHLMETNYNEPFSKLGLRYYGQGEEKGLEKGLIVGERGTVLMVLKARGLRVSESQRELVNACEDLTMLRGWAETALTAETADEVFR